MPVADLSAALERIEHTGGTGALRIARGNTLDVSSLDRVFFPETGYTKGDLMRYYTHVASVILPVMADRPLVLKRSPAGVDGQTFFQQNAPKDVPSAVRVAPIESETGAVHQRIVGGTLATLLYTVQLGCISVDPWHSRLRSLDFADYAVLDLDPGPEAPFERVVEVARWIKDALDARQLTAALKTSGSRGLHICVPLPPRTTYDVALLLAERVATDVAAAHPAAATIERSLKARRRDAVYVDYLQNARGKSLAAPYCVRARPLATVSTPLDWSELAPALDPAHFTIATIPARIETAGDLWRTSMSHRNGPRIIHAAAEGRG